VSVLTDKVKDQKWLDLFLDIIEKAYLGYDFHLDKTLFRLEPTLVRPVDFHKRDVLHSSYGSLLRALDPIFKNLASSEVYRANTGWIAKGINGHNGRKIRRITVGEDVFLLPNLSKQPTIGIDTSGCQDGSTIMVICSIPDYEGAYVWLEKHLKLPKDLMKNEFHWAKLNQHYKRLLLDNFELVLAVCCDSLLVLKSNAFRDRRGKMETIFVNLVSGCFSGFDNDLFQVDLRNKLKQRFFRAVNGVAVHCDDDFTPLSPGRVVRLLVHTLAKQSKNYFESYTPLFAQLYSHESKPIQIADIIAGMVKVMLENKTVTLLRSLPFDLRKLPNYADCMPKAYFWVNEKV